MPNINEFTEVPRRELCVFYVLDTSGSMTGAPIGTLNSAMTETIEVLKQQAKSNADAILKIAVLEFNSGCRWIQPQGPEQMEDFYWQDLKAGGTTDIGAALKELDSKLSRNAFLNSITGSYLPVIIFMTDGYATDNYDKALGEIRQNKWFKNATKIGFAIGDADIKMISEIVGTSEAVVQTDDLELFAKLIKFASVTASMLNSQSRLTTDPAQGKDVIEQAIKQGEAPKDIVDPEAYPEPLEDTMDLGDIDLDGWDDWND